MIFKKKKQILERDQAELYYKILKECFENPFIEKSKVASNLRISENDSTFHVLYELEFISYDLNTGGIVILLPQGFSAYLSISSQKHSALQAQKAIKFATYAIIISIASFIASIIFNLLNICK